ncbi:hypothetical protein L580_0793 [Serratia fonticola AU-P3(3)]|nr:hypothetical protein L580_0793 [Serratia fonticola AU-P3(3)]ERK13526.1 hypothetical protein L581_2633 [Serratia fonticola AU-AP2C]
MMWINNPCAGAFPATKIKKAHQPDAPYILPYQYRCVR